METRKKIYEFVVAYLLQHGYPPSMIEIAAGVGVRSASTVHAHLQEMFVEGILETDQDTGSSRAIRIPGYRFVRADEYDEHPGSAVKAKQVESAIRKMRGGETGWKN